MIGRELLYQVLDGRPRRAGRRRATRAVTLAADPLIEAVLGDDARRLRAPIARARGRARAGAADRVPRDGATCCRAASSCGRWSRPRPPARVQVRLRRAVLAAPGHSTCFYDAPGCTEAWSYHVEVAVPAGPARRARPRSCDDATGAVLAAGARDADRPALYYSADPAQPPLRRGSWSRYGAERVAVPRPGGDRGHRHRPARGRCRGCSPTCRRWPASAGPAIGLVLSTSAVFSALVLRTDEHPLLRLMLVRYRLCLVGVHARRAVRRRGARVPGAAVGHRRHVGGRRAVSVLCGYLIIAAVSLAVVRQPLAEHHEDPVLPPQAPRTSGSSLRARRASARPRSRGRGCAHAHARGARRGARAQPPHPR